MSEGTGKKGNNLHNIKSWSESGVEKTTFC